MSMTADKPLIHSKSSNGALTKICYTCLAFNLNQPSGQGEIPYRR